jgi:hypothetical protein
MSRTVLRATALALLFWPPLLRAQAKESSVLAEAPLMSVTAVAAERRQFLPWVAANRERLGDEQLAGVREHLYLLIGSLAAAHFQATGRALPARDTLGLAELFEYATGLGLVGTDHVVRALVPEAGTVTPANAASGSLTLGLDKGDFSLRSKHGWAIRFPYYFMVSAAQSGVPNNGVETETVMLSTLHAPHEGQPGHSQATILIQAAQAKDTAAFFGYWLPLLQVAPADQVLESPLPNATAFRQFDAARRLHKEVYTLVRGPTAMVVAYMGLPGTYQRNRPDFLALLQSLTFEPRKGR